MLQNRDDELQSDNGIKQKLLFSEVVSLARNW